MDLLLVNSNTSADITELVEREAAAVARPDTRIKAITAPYGACAIETPEDVSVAAEATVEAIRTYEAPIDAAIIACFSDPGLASACQIVDFPVIGIAEAAMFTASMFGARFGILTVAPSSVGTIRNLAGEYGLANRLAGVYAADRGVRESFDAIDDTVRALEELAVQALATDNPDVLILGGAITAGMTRLLADRVPVPVIDGVECAVRQAELLHRIRQRNST